jgi:hypothetical protein
MHLLRRSMHEFARHTGFALVAALLCCPSPSRADTDTDKFREMLRATYDFRPSKLKGEAERSSKSAAMDKVWEFAEAHPDKCKSVLAEEIDRPQADSWFRFDGGSLLLKLDPSPQNQQRFAAAHAVVDFADVNPRAWIEGLTRLAAQGADTTEAALRWLTGPEQSYFLPEHGAMKVDRGYGALFLFGTMDEKPAVAALSKVAADEKHPQRELALSLLFRLHTGESEAFLDKVKQDGLSDGARSAFEARKRAAAPIQRREGKAKSSREVVLKALDAGAKDNWKPFHALVDKIPDGERDFVTVLTGDDLPLVRLARRHLLATANPHMAEMYQDFTNIIIALEMQAAAPGKK